MDFIFNELSFNDPCADIHSGKLRMKDLLHVCKQGRELGISRLAIRHDFYEQNLLETYTVNSWLNDPTVSPILKNLFLSIVRYPYIEEGERLIEERFISSYAYLDEDQVSSVEGLAVAYLYNTVALSFCSSGKWDNHEIALKFSEEGYEDLNVKTKHGSQKSHIDFHQNWIIERVGVKLSIADENFDQKKISLRDDHGKDLLLRFSKKLVRSQFVVEIINSLPFNPHGADFVRQCFDDGKIELVLTHSDEGFGLIVQTTGKNLAETTAIAAILDEEFSDAY